MSDVSVSNPSIWLLKMDQALAGPLAYVLEKRASALGLGHIPRESMALPRVLDKRSIRRKFADRELSTTRIDEVAQVNMFRCQRLHDVSLKLLRLRGTM